MNKILKLQSEIQKKFPPGENRRWPAMLGNASGVVDAGNGDVYVIMEDGQTLILPNTKVPRVVQQVLVGYAPGDPNTLRVLCPRDAFATSAVATHILDHHEDHEFGAFDWVPTQPASIQWMNCLPETDFIIKIYGGIVRLGDVDVTVDNQFIDIMDTVAVPATGALYVSIQCDDSGIVTAKAGLPVDAKELLTNADIPAADTGCWRFYTVMLYDSQIKLQRTKVYNDFVDLRWENLTSTGYIPPVTTAENDFQVGGVGGTLGTWVKKTFTQIKALFKSYFDTIYQPVPVNYAPTVITFGNAATEYDIDGTTWVTSTAGIPDVAGHLTAACLTAIATPYDGTYLAVREHSGAASATNPLTVQFTFPTVATFNVIKFRCRYTGSPSHEISFELYNGATWDIFDTFSMTADYQLHSLEVLVPATYVIAGTVLGRFRHHDSGNTIHTLLIDFVVIGSGGGSGGDSIQSAHQTPFDIAGSIAATDVQAAIEELDTEKVPTTRTLTGTAPITVAGDNSAHDLSANRTIAIVPATASVPGSMSAADKAKLDGITAGASSAAIQTDQTGGTSDTYGLLTGDVNGVNAVYTVSKAVYVIGMLHVYLNGQLQTQGTGQDWVETSPTTGTFTFAVAPPTGSEITAIYTYSVNVVADGSLVITYDGDDVDTIAKTIGGDTVTTTYDFARNGSNQVTQIDKTIDAVTQRKTLTWTGDKVTATSVWVTL